MLACLAGCSDEQPQLPLQAKKPAEPAPYTKLPVYDGQGRILRTVKRVIDGRTIELNGGEKVRLIGVGSTDKYFDDKSVDFIRKTLQGKKVWLEYDEDEVLRKDKSFRTLAYVHYTVKMHAIKRVRLGDTEQDLCMPFENHYVLNEEIIRGGWGRVGREHSFKHREKYLDFEKKAKEARRGLWGAVLDVIYLADGRTLEGKIISESEDEVCLDMAFGTATIDRKQITRIERER